MNSFELFCGVLFKLLLRSLLFSRTFYLRFASFFIALSRGDLFILSLLCYFVNPFFRFLLFLHFISLFLSLFVHFASLLCSFDTKVTAERRSVVTLDCLLYLDKSKLTEQKLCESLEAPPRFELGIKVLQTYALPLGYSAILERITRLELATSTLARWRSTR